MEQAFERYLSKELNGLEKVRFKFSSFLLGLGLTVPDDGRVDEMTLALLAAPASQPARILFMMTNLFDTRKDQLLRRVRCIILINGSSGSEKLQDRLAQMR